MRLDGGTLLLRDPEASDVAVQGAGIDAELLRGTDVPMGRDEPKNLVGVNGPEPAPPPSRPSRGIRGPQARRTVLVLQPTCAAMALTDT